MSETSIGSHATYSFYQLPLLLGNYECFNGDLRKCY